MKKEKKENKLKKKINELKQTSRGKAILKLIGWAIFFLVLFIFCGISALISDNTSNDLPEEKESIKTNEEKVIDLEQQLINSSYNYHYEIKILEETYIFDGKKDKTSDVGYKESKEGIIKYYIDGTGTYQEINQEKVLIDNLYENIDINYLDLDILFKAINPNLKIDVETSSWVSNDDINTYKLELKDTIDSEDNYIKKITINNNEVTYTLEFEVVDS